MGTLVDQMTGDPHDPIAIEPLGRAETAQILETTLGAGAKRSFRALKRLKDVLATMPCGWEGP